MRIPEIPMPSEADLLQGWTNRQERARNDPNCITHWLPRISGLVPTPHTEIVALDLDRERDHELWGMFDGKEVPRWFWDWAAMLRHIAITRVSERGPWFLRTGVFSGKHDWRRTCAVTDIDKIGQHVLALFEMSQLVDMMGLPYHVWAIREWLGGPHLLEYEPFSGMPLRREFRAFAKEGEVLCVHPYWPAEAIDEAVATMPEFVAMNELGTDEAAVRNLASSASRGVEGEWSVDCLWTDRGWYVTDMAIARTSYHWPTCNRLSPE